MAFSPPHRGGASSSTHARSTVRLGIAQQAGGFAEVVIRDHAGKIVHKIPNGQLVEILEDAGNSYIIRCQHGDGNAKKENIIDITHHSTHGLGHLHLGITRAGILEFAQRLGFDHICPPASYIRTAELDFIENEYQVESYNTGRADRGFRIDNHTGYDFVDMVRQWLRDNDHEDKSVCEVLAKEGNPHVGKATVFYSHVQLFGLQCVETTMRRAERRGQVPEDSRYWLDYLSLRQLQQDSTLSQIERTIATIGCTLCEMQPMGRRLPYATRLFCLFELHATVTHKGKVVCRCLNNIGEAILDKNPIDAANATVRDANAQQAILASIVAGGGFTAFDFRVSQVLLDSAKAASAGYTIWLLDEQEQKLVDNKRILAESRA